MAGLYVHIPFCHSKCAYCDFYSMPLRGASAARRYARAALDELRLRRAEVPGPFDTVYFGGGTPSMLDLDTLAALRAGVGEAPVECTIEANPEDVSADGARAWRGMGFDRVSVGVQSLADGELAAVGRRHDGATALRAYETLRVAGFANISLDLIYGLPGQTLESFARSLRALLALRPEHLSAYLLSYEPRTRLTAMLRAGRVAEVDEDTVAAMYAMLCREAAAAGYEHYEISNFALPGRRAAHNSAYWDGTPYLGLGPGAHSYDGSVRRYNPSDLRGYLAAIEDGRTACVTDDEDDDSRWNDSMITALRTARGLRLDTVPPRRLERLLRDARRSLDSGLLTADAGTLRIPERHWLVADAVMRDLIQ